MGHILQANVEAGLPSASSISLRADATWLPEHVDKIGQGRVWTGRKALELGLVDGLGQLPDASRGRGQRAGMTDYQVRFIEKPLSAREQLLQQIADSLGFASTRYRDGRSGRASSSQLDARRRSAAHLRAVRHLQPGLLSDVTSRTRPS